MSRGRRLCWVAGAQEERVICACAARRGWQQQRRRQGYPRALRDGGDMPAVGGATMLPGTPFQRVGRTSGRLAAGTGQCGGSVHL